MCKQVTDVHAFPPLSLTATRISDKQNYRTNGRTRINLNAPNMIWMHHWLS